MELPIKIPEDKIHQFETWRSLLTRALMLSGIDICVPEEAAKFMFMQELSPHEACSFTIGMNLYLGATDEQLPYDEGAELPLETRVVKINSKIGDFVEDGAVGTVKGFRHAPDMHPLYLVYWDGHDTPLGEPIINGVIADGLKKEELT